MTRLLVWLVIFVLAFALVRVLDWMCRGAMVIRCAVFHALLRRYGSDLQCHACGEFVHLARRTQEFGRVPRMATGPRENVARCAGPVVHSPEAPE